MKGVRLKRLKIDKYRNVEPGTELVFNDGFNVLLGKNGTGKTTLLRLIAMVVTGTFGHLKDDDLGLEYELAASGLRIIANIRNEPQKDRMIPSSQVDNVSIDTSSLQNEPRWSCEVIVRIGEGSSAHNRCTISTNPLNANLRFEGKDHPIAVQSPFEHNPLYHALIRLAEIVRNPETAPEDTTRIAWLPLVDDLFATARLLERTMTNGGRFDEALGSLDAITGGSVLDDAGDIRVAFLGVLEKETNTRFSKFIPSELRKAVSTKTTSDLETGNLRFAHGSLRFLQEAVRTLGLNGATLVAPLDRKEILTEERNVFIYIGFEFLLTLADGTIISHKHLSYGQKRLLSFLYYAACNPDIVIADELVNGLHYEWIGACLKEIQDRQSFLTSQNPILLDMLPFESADEVQRSFILCSNEVRHGRGQMVWKTMSEQSADRFFRAYETQALQVSEVLRVNDLW